VTPALNWHEIDTVLLDMDGTLLDLHFDNYFWRQHLPACYAKRHGMPVAEATAYLAQLFAQHQGSLQWYCLDFWRETLALDIVALKHEIAHLIAVRHDVEVFLAALRQAGKHVVLVTNSHPDGLALKMRCTGLTPHFDLMMTSHQLGLAKEQAGFWERLHAVVPFEAERAVLFDDSLAVLRNAQRYGIRHLRSIYQPDSQSPVQDVAGFAAISRFGEVLPV
jgi:5'-nucleotidase